MRVVSWKNTYNRFQHLPRALPAPFRASSSVSHQELLDWSGHAQGSAGRLRAGRTAPQGVPPGAPGHRYRGASLNMIDSRVFGDRLRLYVCGPCTKSSSLVVLPAISFSSTSLTLCVDAHVVPSLLSYLPPSGEERQQLAVAV